MMEETFYKLGFTQINNAVFYSLFYKDGILINLTFF
ncbi:Uncharacterised protein [Elizabethkingia meningoseptica]|nr:Uncharacterised protein [Elizabethkingia meningoseptica]